VNILVVVRNRAVDTLYHAVVGTSETLNARRYPGDGDQSSP
jgi:hypothetical protein